jgi:hypothetical protein
MHRHRHQHRHRAGAHHHDGAPMARTSLDCCLRANYSLKFEASGFQHAGGAVGHDHRCDRDGRSRSNPAGWRADAASGGSRETEAVQTASSTVGTVVSSQTMTAMPLTSRNYTNLLGLSAGANAACSTRPTWARGTQDIAVNGSQRAEQLPDGRRIHREFGGRNGYGADSGGSILESGL